MKKTALILSLTGAALAVAVAATQLTLFTVGTGSTHLLTRTGVASEMPFFASDEQMCAGAGASLSILMCKRMAESYMHRGPQHVLTLPYMGFVRSLSLSRSSDN